MNQMPQTDNSPAFISRSTFLVLASFPFIAAILKFVMWDTYGVFDFHTFHLAGTLANQGQAQLSYQWLDFIGLFGPTYGEASDLPWFYPPILLPYAQGLALMDISSAYLVFCMVSLVSYYLTVYYLFWDNFREIIALSVFPLLIPIAFGHPTIIFLVFLLLAYRLSRNHPVLALILLTLAATKPHTGGVILFLYFIKTLPKSILPSIIIAAVAIGTTSLIYGADIWLAFYEQMNEASKMLLGLTLESDWRASAYHGLKPLPISEPFKWLGHFAFLGAICSLAAFAFKDAKHDQFWAVAGIAAFFTSPYIIIYDNVVLLFPLILVLVNSDIRAKRPWLLAVLFLEFIPLAFFGQENIYKYNFTAILLFVLAMLMIKISRNRPATS